MNFIISYLHTHTHTHTHVLSWQQRSEVTHPDLGWGSQWCLIWRLRVTKESGHEEALAAWKRRPKGWTVTQPLYEWLHELLSLLLLSKEEEGKYHEILAFEEILEFMSCNFPSQSKASHSESQHTTPRRELRVASQRAWRSRHSKSQIWKQELQSQSILFRTVPSSFRIPHGAQNFPWGKVSVHSVGAYLRQAPWKQLSTLWKAIIPVTPWHSSLARFFRQLLLL